jgi:tagatose-1,6-bisphosphate aldolase
MSEQIINEIKKLAAIATDMDLSNNIRVDAVKSIGAIGTRESLLTLLELVANEKLNTDERELALKQAKKIVRAAR